MNILSRSRESLDKKDLYFMVTDSSIKKISEIPTPKVKISDWVIYEDTSRQTGEIYKVISIKTDTGVYASNSPTLIECFEKIVECFGSDFTEIEIFKGKSNRGREFIQCRYIA